MVHKRGISFCPWIGVVRNSHVTLGVMVRKQDMQPICSSFNDVHLPCYMMLMCYLFHHPSKPTFVLKLLLLDLLLSNLPDIDSWSIHRTIVSLIATTPVTLVQSMLFG